MTIRAHVAAFIEQRLADADLGADLQCGVLKFSRAALRGLFGDSGGVARYIRSRRRNDAMCRLADPGYARHRIGEIVFLVEFSSEPIFNRALWGRFGCSPGEARAGARGLTQAGETSIGESASALVAKYEASVRNLRGYLT